MSQEKIREDFDRIARLMAEGPEHPDRYEGFLLDQIPGQGARVLEVGCGAGRLARAIASRGAVVIAIDLSPEMIRLARRRTGADIPVEFVCGDFTVHPLGSQLYDCVVSVATLHHLPMAPALERMKSLVRPGGMLLIHDLRALSGGRDWLASGLAAAFNGDASWWIRTRLRERRALRAAWHHHGARERYPTSREIEAIGATTLPGARIVRHPLWRYTVVWTRAAQES